MNVADKGKQVGRVINKNRFVAPLKKMAETLLAIVEPSRKSGQAFLFVYFL